MLTMKEETASLLFVQFKPNMDCAKTEQGPPLWEVGT